MEIEKMPRHIAIIMDGNRRWARNKNLPVKLGHKEGAKTIEKIVEYANKIGIKYITVYAFSTENWKRSKEEVDSLMLLLRNYLDKYSKKAETENIIIKVLGDMSALNEDLRKSIADAVNRTKNNTGTTFAVALNYGGRDELLKGIRKISQDVKNGVLDAESISEEVFENYLYTAGMPDPDLLIRTSGEFRTSNFLPWQLVYSEFVFLEKNWPDFTEEDFDFCIEEFKKRNRKFGAK
ncbi:MAG: isoprenyl transferase [Clostridia bacterium]|nr:isoprenyl transferase [Clostridia bacterium]